MHSHAAIVKTYIARPFRRWWVLVQLVADSLK